MITVISKLELEQPLIRSLIGEWQPLKQVDFYDNGNIDSYDYTNCQRQSRYIFESDGNFDFFNTILIAMETV